MGKREIIYRLVKFAAERLGYYTEVDVHYEHGFPMLLIFSGPERYGGQLVMQLCVFDTPIPDSVYTAHAADDEQQTKLFSF
jgi:hypothetical protein